MDKSDLLELINNLDPEQTKKLTLSNKGITEIPDEIGVLSNLEHLDLSYNSIQEIPAAVFSLKRLKSLLLFRNEISELPDGIRQLRELRMLDLSYNSISQIPTSISAMVSLADIDFSFNKITHLPVELINLSSLMKLELDENPLVFPPAKIVRRGLYATMFHLTNEKKRRESSKVLMHVYNMPGELRSSFNQYMQYFNDLIKAANKKEVQFDISHISPDISSEVEINSDVKSYINNFLQFVRENVKSINANVTHEEEINILDLQVADLRNEITSLHHSLDDKVSEMLKIQDRITKLYESLERK